MSTSLIRVPLSYSLVPHLSEEEEEQQQKEGEEEQQQKLNNNINK